MMKRLFLLFVLLSALAVLINCGSAEDDDDDTDPVVVNLIVTANSAGLGDLLWCSGPGPGWIDFPFAANHQAVIENIPPGTYTCNIELACGNWAVHSLTEQLFSAMVQTTFDDVPNPAHALTPADIVPNGLGGGNWQFVVGVGGIIN